MTSSDWSGLHLGFRKGAMPIVRPMTCFSEWTLKSLQIGFMSMFKVQGDEEHVLEF